MERRTLDIFTMKSLMQPPSSSHFKDAVWCWKLWLKDEEDLSILEDLNLLWSYDVVVVVERQLSFQQLEKRSLASLSDWTDLAKASSSSSSLLLLLCNIWWGSCVSVFNQYHPTPRDSILKNKIDIYQHDVSIRIDVAPITISQCLFIYIL
jgi:hypothetical protein